MVEVETEQAKYNLLHSLCAPKRVIVNSTTAIPYQQDSVSVIFLIWENLADGWTCYCNGYVCSTDESDSALSASTQWASLISKIHGHPSVIVSWIMTMTLSSKLPKRSYTRKQGGLEDHRIETHENTEYYAQQSTLLPTYKFRLTSIPIRMKYSRVSYNLTISWTYSLNSFFFLLHERMLSCLCVAASRRDDPKCRIQQCLFVLK